MKGIVMAYKTFAELKEEKAAHIAEIRALLDTIEKSHPIGAYKDSDVNYQLRDVASTLRLAEYYYNKPEPQS